MAAKWKIIRIQASAYRLPQGQHTAAKYEQKPQAKNLPLPALYLPRFYYKNPQKKNACRRQRVLSQFRCPKRTENFSCYGRKQIKPRIIAQLGFALICLIYVGPFLFRQVMHDRIMFHPVARLSGKRPDSGMPAEKKNKQHAYTQRSF